MLHKCNTITGNSPKRNNITMRKNSLFRVCGQRETPGTAVAPLASGDGVVVSSENSILAHEWVIQFGNGSKGIMVRKVRKVAVMDQKTEHPSSGWTIRMADVVTQFFYLTNTKEANL